MHILIDGIYDKTSNRTKHFYAMYPKMTFANIALLSLEFDVRKDKVQIWNETDREQTKKEITQKQRSKEG